MPINQEILGYLAQHPAAQDTLEGIVEWWVLEQTIKQASSDVKAVLIELVAESLIEQVEGSDGRVYYRANRSMLDTEPSKSGR